MLLYYYEKIKDTKRYPFYLFYLQNHVMVLWYRVEGVTPSQGVGQRPTV